MSKIQFRVDKEGMVFMEVDGVEGQLCETMTAPFEEALGIQVDTQKKPEYYVCLDELEQHVSEEE